MPADPNSGPKIDSPSASSQIGTSDIESEDHSRFDVLRSPDPFGFITRWRSFVENHRKKNYSVTVSYLRKQRQAERQAKAEYPSRFQKTFTYSEEILLLALAFWGYVKGLAKYISPTISYGGILGIVIIYVLLRTYLRKFPQKWVTGNRTELVSSIPRRGNVIFVLMVLSLLIPRVVDWVSPPPQTEISLAKAPGRYAPGSEVEGIKWRENFSDYRLVFKNKDGSVELVDLRIDLEVPAGVVKSTILSSKGVDTISAAPFGMTATRGNEAGQKTGPIISYSTSLLITAVRIFPSAEFSTRIILMDPFAGKTVTGKDPATLYDICVSFYYDDFWGNRSKQVSCYPILQEKDPNELSLSIDLKNPKPISTEARTRGGGVVFDEPQAAKDLNVILSPP